jgi:hypothetical protein
MPVWTRQPGDTVACELCGKPVVVVPPPAEGTGDPWPGSRVARVPPHGSKD